MEEFTHERLEGSYSEGEALAIYNEVKANGNFALFTRQFMGDSDYQVARNALWAMTKATDQEIRQLQPLLDESGIQKEITTIAVS